MTKRNMVWRLVLGVFLGYTGIKLIIDALTERPESYKMFAAFGIGFTVIAVAWVALGVRNCMKNGFIEESTDDDEAEDEEEAAEEEAAADQIEEVEEKAEIEEAEEIEEKEE